MAYTLYKKYVKTVLAETPDITLEALLEKAKQEPAYGDDARKLMGVEIWYTRLTAAKAEA